MYTGIPRRVAFTAPWQRPFAERRAVLGRGALRVAYFYETPDTSTFRYRVHNMIEALEGTEVSATWFCRAELREMPDVLQGADVLVLCRTRYSGAVAALVDMARARGIRVLFDVDDLVFDDRYVQLVLETLDQRGTEEAWNHWFAYIARMGAALRLCDAAITTNDFLAARIEDFAGIPAAVVPNFLNRGQIALSRRILEAKEASGFARDDRLHIGYFSGTPTHNRDFGIVADALAERMLEDPRLRLRVVGFLEPRGSLAPLRDRIEYLPLQDYLNLQRLIGEVEINLVPLQDNVFTNCKSELKFFEAAVAGTLTLASPSHTLAAAIRDGVTGHLVPSQSWPEALRRATAEVDAHPAVTRRAAEAAYAAYAPETQTQRILAALRGTGISPAACPAAWRGCGTAG